MALVLCIMPKASDIPYFEMLASKTAQTYAGRRYGCLFKDEHAPFKPIN